MYEKTIYKVSEVFFLQYLNLCTMPELLTLRHNFNDKFSIRTSIQTKSKCTLT